MILVGPTPPAAAALYASGLIAVQRTRPAQRRMSPYPVHAQAVCSDLQTAWRACVCTALYSENSPGSGIAVPSNLPQSRQTRTAHFLVAFRFQVSGFVSSPRFKPLRTSSAALVGPKLLRQALPHCV